MNRDDNNRTSSSGSREKKESTLLQEVIVSLAIVVLIGLLLFAASGVWPPFVAIESGSMEPNLAKGDLIFVIDEDRFVPESDYGNTGIVTHERGAQTDYQRYGDYGHTIIYHPDGNEHETPIIHRSMFWVDEGENWYDQADKQYIDGASNCEELQNCPAPNDGFITKGDANPTYDQSSGISKPVDPTWIIGTAELRIPWLGWIRLLSAISLVGLHIFLSIPSQN